MRGSRERVHSILFDVREEDMIHGLIIPQLFEYFAYCCHERLIIGRLVENQRECCITTQKVVSGKVRVVGCVRGVCKGVG